MSQAKHIEQSGLSIFQKLCIHASETHLRAALADSEAECEKLKDALSKARKYMSHTKENAALINEIDKLLSIKGL